MLRLSKVNQSQFVNSLLNQIAENLLEIFTKQTLYKNRGNMFAKNFIRKYERRVLFLKIFRLVKSYVLPFAYLIPVNGRP